MAEELGFMVNDIASQLDKKVIYNILGNDVFVPPSVHSQLKDCMLHLVRNTLDHGIEKSDERLRYNKSEKGKVEITFLEDLNWVTITFKDDGSGIDSEKVLAVAVEKGIVTAEVAATMTKDEKLQLIFKSNFSN